MHSPFWNATVKFGPAVIVAVFYVTAVMHYTYTPDDTYIYLQYAKNIAAGNGFAFNANTPSYGVTGPLWVLMIAAGAKAGIDPFIVAKTLDMLFAGLAIILVFTFSAILIKDKVYAFFAAMVVSGDAWFLRWSGSGMETSFAVILVLLAVKYSYSGDYHIAAFVSGLLTLVRPEGALLFVVLQLESFIVSFVLGRNRRMFWTAFLVYLLVVLPWVVFSWKTFGQIVPNTELAKTAVRWSMQSVMSTMVDSVQVLGSTQLLMILLLMVGVPLAIVKGGIGTFIAKAMPVLWVVVLVLGYVVLNAQVVSRYLVPVTPLIVIYALWSLKQMEISFQWSSKKTLVALCTISLATIVQNQLVYRIAVVPHMQAFAAGMERGIRPIAVWLHTNSDTQASVLTPDIGLLGYIADRDIFDTAGLVTPSVKRAFNGISYDDGMNRQLYRSVVNPDFVVDRSTTIERLATDSLRPVMTTEFGDLGLRKSGIVFYTLYKATR